MSNFKQTMGSYKQNIDIAYKDEPYAANNVFIGKQIQNVELPAFDEIKEQLPKPIWQGHDVEIESYYKAWEIAFSNLRNPQEESGLISPFIDTAFNGNLFMWDSAFILMFGKYADKIFHFQGTIDNFYALQHRDGFISRELLETNGTDRFSRFDPVSTGPNVLAWCEWEYFRMYHNRERLKDVFDPLFAYHRWLREYRTWRDGSYWSSGLGCGMDNLPRLQSEYSVHFSHGHMVWVDACFQQIMNCEILVKIAGEIGRAGETDELIREKKQLTEYVNDKQWDEKSEFYYDLWKNGKLNGVKTVAPYWGLMTNSIPKERLSGFVGHLNNKNEFNRHHRVPVLSADNRNYNPRGDYWRGSIWAPTNYMILNGLARNGLNLEAYEIACNTVKNVTECYKETGTFWENYAPEFSERGNSSRGDFVGWTGLIPISILIEYVLGIRRSTDGQKIIWYINRCEKHGIVKYPLRNGEVTLICEDRSSSMEKPRVSVISDVPVEVECIWDGGSFHVKATQQ